MLDAALQAVPRVRRTDPSTSIEAAWMAQSVAKSHQDKILALLRSHKRIGGEPMGAEQIGFFLGIEPYAVRKRLPELMRDGFVVAVGERKTSTGRTERTWESLW
jgi:predicted ArsR family transcriptional regulator